MIYGIRNECKHQNFHEIMCVTIAMRFTKYRAFFSDYDQEEILFSYVVEYWLIPRKQIY